MKLIPPSHVADIRAAQLIARQFGLSAANDAVDQLVDQFAAFRREREQQLAELKAEFDDAIAELQAELDRTKAEYAVLKLLSQWPQDRARMQ
jgi:hypothetical protein